MKLHTNAALLGGPLQVNHTNFKPASLRQPSPLTTASQPHAPVNNTLLNSLPADASASALTVNLPAPTPKTSTPLFEVSFKF